MANRYTHLDMIAWVSFHILPNNTITVNCHPKVIHKNPMVLSVFSETTSMSQINTVFENMFDICL